MLLLHHDDAEREYAYDRDSAVGRLNQALDAARGGLGGGERAGRLADGVPTVTEGVGSPGQVARADAREPRGCHRAPCGREEWR